MGHHSCNVISQNLLLHFQEKQLWVTKQGWPCISASNMYCSVAYAHEECSLLAPTLHYIHIHFTLFIKYSQIRDQVFCIKLLHIFALTGAVKTLERGIPNRRGSYLQLGLHRIQARAVSGDMQCLAHLLLSQHRKTANFHVNVAVIGTKYAEFLSSSSPILFKNSMFLRNVTEITQKSHHKRKAFENSIQNAICFVKHISSQ